MTADIAGMKATDAITLHEGYFAAACLPASIGASVGSLAIDREHRDSSKRKFVLYQNTERIALTAIVFRTKLSRDQYLGTNVINVLVKRCTHVFAQEPIPPNIARPNAPPRPALRRGAV